MTPGLGIEPGTHWKDATLSPLRHPCSPNICQLERVLVIYKNFVEWFHKAQLNAEVPIAPFTTPFNNMRTLKFRAQPTNPFFATVNQMFGGSSQLPITAERVVIKSLSTDQAMKHRSAVVGSWEKPPNIWLTVAKNAFVGWALNFRVCMLLKGAVIKLWSKSQNDEATTLCYFTRGTNKRTNSYNRPIRLLYRWSNHY